MVDLKVYKTLKGISTSVSILVLMRRWRISQENFKEPSKS